MTRCRIVLLAVLGACVAEPASSTGQQAFMQNQGTQLHGVQLVGVQVQGMTLQGFQLDGATRHGAALRNVRVERGELVAELGQATLHGADLVDVHVFALVANAATPPQTAQVEFRITAVTAEDPAYDPTQSGSSFLYAIEQNVDGSDTWQAACGVDNDSRQVAIPIAATWDDRGNRVESSALFSFGCTTGVVAKCYRWGYRPWLTGHGNLASVHWACTRMARADYCGNGTSYTRNGTVINLWDNTAPPGPIERQGTTPLGMLFEAGWSTSGAVCLSHARWLIGGPVIALGCPGRLLAPGLGILGATVCDTTAEALGQSASAQMFNESYLNLIPDPL